MSAERKIRRPVARMELMQSAGCNQRSGPLTPDRPLLARKPIFGILINFRADTDFLAVKGLAESTHAFHPYANPVTLLRLHNTADHIDLRNTHWDVATYFGSRP